MNYVIANASTGHVEARFPTLRGAKISYKRKYNSNPELVVTTAQEARAVRELMHGGPTRIVKNLMSGEPVEIDIDTPRVCDPSTETYWCT